MRDLLGYFTHLGDNLTVPTMQLAFIPSMYRCYGNLEPASYIQTSPYATAMPGLDPWIPDPSVFHRTIERRVHQSEPLKR